MTINVNNIHTGGAVVTLGGTVNAADVDGYYWGTVSGTDIGCTSNGVNVSYKADRIDIFCDQVLAPVEAALTQEEVEISFSLLESEAANLALAIAQDINKESSTESKVGVGGITTIVFNPLKLEITDNFTGLLTTWTFFKCLSEGIGINFDRAKPSEVPVKFKAYADLAHLAGQQLFTIHQALT